LTQPGDVGAQSRTLDLISVLWHKAAINGAQDGPFSGEAMGCPETPQAALL